MARQVISSGQIVFLQINPPAITVGDQSEATEVDVPYRAHRPPLIPKQQSAPTSPEFQN
jgi:hypothetical protein